MIWIIRRLATSRRHWRGDEIVVQYDFRFSGLQTSMFCAVFILHILQNGLLVLEIIKSLIFRINIHSLVLFPKRSQLPEKIKDMYRNEMQTSCWSHFSVVFGQLLPLTLHGKE
jgi:hypothetical protein